jgi:hypothetical protein
VQISVQDATNSGAAVGTGNFVNQDIDQFNLFLLPLPFKIISAVKSQLV